MGRSNGIHKIHKIHKIGTAVWLQAKTPATRRHFSGRPVEKSKMSINACVSNEGTRVAHIKAFGATLANTATIANAEHSIAGLKWFVDQKDTRMRTISTRKDRPSIEKLKPCTHPPAHYRKPKMRKYPEIDGQQTLAVCRRYKCIFSPASNRRVAYLPGSPPRALSHDPQSVACVPAAVTAQFILFAQGLGSDRPVLIAASLRLSSRIIPWIPVLAVAGATAVSFIICYFSNLMCRTAVSWFPFRLLLLFHGSTRMPNRTRLTQWICCHFCADCVWRGIKIWPCQGSDSTSNSKSKTDRKAKSRMKKN
ncbi:GD21958 [Drosophila simulans]|uniref:GD21958 n=1 Tax=Drosophila simulans TaxID=7240 RepID=B4Q6E3_DROSI|nr:GD21958 [Drosophila simulans]